MDEFIARQYAQMRFKISDFRQGALSFNNLIQQLEGLARAVGEEFWSEKFSPLVVDLEGINSVLIDKRREMTLSERESVERLLTDVEVLINSETKITRE